MREHAKWMADVYLHTDRNEDEIFAILQNGGFGIVQPFHSIDGDNIELSADRNPDMTGNSPVGFARLLVEVARPPAARLADLEAAYSALLDLLKKSGISHSSITSKNE